MMNDKPGSVAHRVIQFLRDCEHDVTTTELSASIGYAGNRLAHKLNPAMRAGLLCRRIENGFAFWTLGPKADLEVPPPVGDGEQTIVKVSALAAPSVFAYADQRKAAPFSVALHTDGRLAIERHGRLLLELTNSERIHLVNAAMQGVQPCAA